MTTRNLAYFCVAILSIGSALPAAAPVEASTEVGFRQVWYSEVALPSGYYVFRDSEEWNEEFVPHWPSILGSPPQPGFSDSLMIALSYGWTACSQTGGEVISIIRDADKAVVSLGHVYTVMPQCLAESPRVLYYRISKSDVPDDVELVFEEASLPYELSLQSWYPLAVGNAWHFDIYQSYEWVEIVDATETVDGDTWYRIVTAYCSEEPCPQPAVRYLRWTDDHYLLASEAPLGAVPPDTLHATYPRSIFTVNVPRDETLVGQKGPVDAYIWLHIGWPFGDHLWLFAYPYSDGQAYASYVYGAGPYDLLVAAIIDGVDLGDTSFIRTALSTTSGPAVHEYTLIEVYPHPAGRNSVISVRAVQSGIARMAVYDLLGRSVMNVEAEVSSGMTWEVPLGAIERLAPGVYVVRAVDPNGRSTSRSLVLTE